VWNLVSHTRGKTETKDIWEQVAEENILTEEGESDRRLEKTA
jgi:hypothetical protein